MARTATNYYNVSREKKETKMLFCNISYKTQVLLTKYGILFPEYYLASLKWLDSHLGKISSKI